MADDGTPYAAMCFAVLAIAYTVVIVVIFAIEQFKASAAEGGGVGGAVQGLMPSDGRTREFVEMMLTAFSAENLANAKAAMSMVPTVSILMLYVMLRAKDQQIFENDPKYETAQVGMAWATFGLLVLALDALTIRVQSEVLGNLSQTIGTSILAISYAILLWALLTVRDEYHDLSTSARALTALSVLVIGCLLTIKGLQLWQKWNPLALLPVGKTAFDRLSGVVTEEKVLEVQAASSYAPMMMIAFFYSHFEHLGGAPASQTETVATTVCVVGVFCQALAAVLRTSAPPTDAAWWGWVTGTIKALSLVPTYAAFVVVLHSALAAGPTSDAAFCLLVLLLVVAVLKLLTVAIMEGKRYVLDTINDDNVEWATKRAEDLSNLFKSMMGAAALAEILALVLAYLHLRPKIVLAADPQVDLKGRWGLLPAAFAATSAVFVLMTVLVVDFLAGGEGSAVSKIGKSIQTVSLVVLNISLFATAVHVLG